NPQIVDVRRWEERSIDLGCWKIEARSMVEIDGVRLSHPERVSYPADAITKEEIARYYQAIGAWALPHVRARPLTLLRCPSDIDRCAFMGRHAARGPPRLRHRRTPG